MGKTIKQIADEIGVSKTAVMKQIANLGLQTSLRKNGNQFAKKRKPVCD
jgi:biotin operon repressor